MRLKNQTGDTIVEVLLSLTVLGLVIGTAYAIANRSLIRAQQSQERTTALKLAEGQVDSIKYLSESTNTDDLVTLQNLETATDYCLGGETDAEGAMHIKAYLADSEDCQEGVFSYSISYNTKEKLFNVRVDWNAIGSGNAQNVTIQYRVVQ